LKGEGKVKGTEAVLSQLPGASADAATCPPFHRLAFDSLIFKEQQTTKQGKVKGHNVPGSQAPDLP
jgi:hypothetical protein